MLRALAAHLVGLPILVLALVVIGLACGAPPDESRGSPAAQATNVRRTAVAEVQAILANKPTSTPLPEPTSTPMPSCANAIWWTDARSHSGESRTVQGTVVGHRADAGGAILLELGQPYPDPTGILVHIPQSTNPDAEGHMVCATGRIVTNEGRTMVELTGIGALKVDPA